MREIKFRAWDKARNKFWYDSVETGEEFYLCGTEEPQEYTGLKDKNGKEIYEGDILQSKNGSKTVVAWGEINRDDCDCQGEISLGWGWNLIYPEFDEIIGNICERSKDGKQYQSTEGQV